MKKIIIACLFLPVLISCEKILFEESKKSIKAQENFDYLWKQCNEKYSYFEVKDIDWELVRLKYSSRIYADMSQDSLFNVLGGMLRELKDDHTNLISGFNVSRFGVVYLGQDNFDWRIVEDHYLNRDYLISGPFSHNFLANGEVGYIRFPSFTGTMNKENLNYILNKYKNTKGLIIDLRENGGGAVSDVFKLLSRFIEEPRVVYYSRIKNGKEHTNFSSIEPVIIAPSKEIRYTKKVMMLVDRGTYSAGSLTSIATKAIPNITLVGDTTGGGLGLPNGGQLPNGWTYRFSVTQTLSLDKNPVYEKGVPPDVSVLMDWSDLTKDEVIEEALNQIL